MTRPVKATEPERDHEKDFRILCEQCKRDFGGTVGAAPGHIVRWILCPTCKYGSFENFLAQQPEPPAIVPDLEQPPVQVIQVEQPSRYVLCDAFSGGCGKGFDVSNEEYISGISHICQPCEYKRLTLQLLHEQKKLAARYGHTQPGDTCELCAIQNQIDAQTNYNWREIYERLQETVARSYEREALTR